MESLDSISSPADTGGNNRYITSSRRISMIRYGSTGWGRVGVRSLYPHLVSATTYLTHKASRSTILPPLRTLRQMLRRMFRFRPLEFVLFLLAAALGAAMSNHFYWAYCLMAICLLWAESWWFVSDHLLNARRDRDRLPRRHQRLAVEVLAKQMKRQVRKYRIIKWGVALLLLFFGAVGGAKNARMKYKWDLQQTFGLLAPAHDDDPKNPCNATPGDTDFRIYAGGNLIYSRGTDIPLLTIDGTEVLSASLNGSSMSISGDIYGPDGDLAHIDRNVFETPSGGYKPRRPDKHTLEVIDNWHNTVLYVRFLNKHAIRLRGVFRYDNGVVTITDRSITMGNQTFTGHNCINAGTRGLELDDKDGVAVD